MTKNNKLYQKNIFKISENKYISSKEIKPKENEKKKDEQKEKKLKNMNNNIKKGVNFKKLFQINKVNKEILGNGKEIDNHTLNSYSVQSSKDSELIKVQNTIIKPDKIKKYFK